MDDATGGPESESTPLQRIWLALRGRGGPGGAGAPAGAVPTAPGGSMLAPVIDALPNPTIALGRDMQVLAFNGPAAALAPALRHGAPIFHALRTPDLIEAIRRAATTHEPQQVEIVERMPDRWFEVVVVPMRGTGDPDMLLLTFNDRTPLRRVEEMRADFVANASHELRTPLAALLGFIETLQGPARDDTAARERFLGIMQNQATRMARLIDDLLSLSRIELNAHLRPGTPVELSSIVRQVVDGLQTLARDRGVAIKVAGADETLVVLGDRDELIRALENLVENALKYGASGKEVEITLGRHAAGAGGEATVTVRDHGPGIAPEHLPRLTERFYRVDVADSRAQGGTGLGLALVKHVLNRHGGRLSVTSTPGQGATFTVHLPLHTARAAETDNP
ncbi:MAG: Phosphate regulon sensor protein PhoR (SphS) [Pseudolabrys sp.]|jgi:two-component system phosphate regulon sensor histidine kinase PhoR|nr:Phosphate regulon sensor protein PhoR (SphS) [Pseudolabrys sp.]